MVLALPLAAMESNTATGPCTATCSRGAKYNNWSLHCHSQSWSQIQQLVLVVPLAAAEPTTSGPCTATCSSGARYSTGPCTANAAVEPDLTQKKQPCLLEFGCVREGDRASKASDSEKKDSLLH